MESIVAGPLTADSEGQDRVCVCESSLRMHQSKEAREKTEQERARKLAANEVLAPCLVDVHAGGVIWCICQSDCSLTCPRFSCVLHKCLHCCSQEVRKANLPRIDFSGSFFCYSILRRSVCRKRAEYGFGEYDFKHRSQ